LVSMHVEIGDTADLIAKAAAARLRVGLALNPNTPFSAVEPFLDSIDLLLVMCVFPGFAASRSWQKWFEDRGGPSRDH